MMEYKLISSTDAVFVTNAVNESLAEGWELLGSVAVGVVPGAHIIPVVYVQAMTKREIPTWIKRLEATRTKPSQASAEIHEGIEP